MIATKFKLSAYYINKVGNLRIRSVPGISSLVADPCDVNQYEKGRRMVTLARTVEEGQHDTSIVVEAERKTLLLTYIGVWNRP